MKTEVSAEGEIVSQVFVESTSETVEPEALTKAETIRRLADEIALLEKEKRSLEGQAKKLSDQVNEIRMQLEQKHHVHHSLIQVSEDEATAERKASQDKERQERIDTYERAISSGLLTREQIARSGLTMSPCDAAIADRNRHARGPQLRPRAAGK